MKVNIYFPLLITLPFITMLMGCRPSNNCSNIKYGKYYYFEKTTKHKIEVERDDTIQFERDLVTGSVMRSKIVWINKCQYQLFINVSPKSDLTFQKKEEIPINIEIINVKDNFYSCKGTSYVDGKRFETLDTFYFNK